MPTIRGSFVVDAPIDVAFLATHEVEDWPSSNPLVEKVEIIEREGNKTVFRLTHADGRSWNTSMFAIPEYRISFSERMEPQPPLRCMQYVRTYTPRSASVTEITEEVRFELLPNSNIDEASAVDRMSAHMLEVQPHIKNHVEARARTAQQGR